MKKILERNLQDVVIGGVCSGIADYTEIDPIIWRFIFFILLFTQIPITIIYVALWIIMPTK